MAILCTVIAMIAVMPSYAETQQTEQSTSDISATYAANVLDYGADPTGKQDSTEAISQACKKNKQVYLPAGIYKVSKLSISGSVTLQGSGSNTTTIKTTNLAGNVLTFKDDGWHLKDLKFDAVANRTDGAYVYSSADYASIENVSFNRHYIGIDLDGCCSVTVQNITAFDGTPDATAPGGALIRMGKNMYTGSINICGLYAKPSSGTLQPSSCIIMGWVDVVFISDATIIWHKRDIVIAPQNHQFAALVEMTNCCFDTSENGIFIQPTGGARVLRCGFVNTWFGAHQTGDGAVIDGSDGEVTGLQFTNCLFMHNNGNGVAISGSQVDGIFFSNCFSAANTGNGLMVTQDARNVVWSGGAIGACQGSGGNGLSGYAVEEGCSGSVINAILTGNTLGMADDPAEAFKTSGNSEDD